MDLQLDIANPEFDDERNFFVKLDVTFGSGDIKPSPAQRTDVAAPASKKPQFQTSHFRFSIPSELVKPLLDTYSTLINPSNNTKPVNAEIQCVINVNVFCVEKVQDGGATVIKVGSHTLKIPSITSFWTLSKKGQSDWATQERVEFIRLTPDVKPGTNAKIMGSFQLGLKLDITKSAQSTLNSMHSTEPNVLLPRATHKNAFYQKHDVENSEGFGRLLFARSLIDIESNDVPLTDDAPDNSSSNKGRYPIYLKLLCY
jgi:hypothetical protein